MLRGIGFGVRLLSTASRGLVDGAEIESVMGCGDGRRCGPYCIFGMMRWWIHRPMMSGAGSSCCERF